MYGEVEEREVLGAVADLEHEFELIVVIYLAALYLEDLYNRLSRLHEVFYTLRERCSVDIQLGAVGVAVVRQLEREQPAAGRGAQVHLPGVTQLDAELGTLVSGDVGLLVVVNTDLRHSKCHGRIVENHTRVVELGLLFLLVDTEGRTGFGEEDITAVELVVIATVVDILADRGCEILPQRVRGRTIDADGDVALVIGRDGETGGLLLRHVVRCAGVGIEIQCWHDLQAPFGLHALITQVHLIPLQPFRDARHSVVQEIKIFVNITFVENLRYLAALLQYFLSQLRSRLLCLCANESTALRQLVVVCQR